MKRLLAALAAAWALAPLSAEAATSSQVWHPVGDTPTPHAGGTATELYDGTVLLVGGTSFDFTMPGGVELYDPIHRRFVSLPPLATPRADQSAIRLDDGRVLIFGGEPPGRAGAVGPTGPLDTTAIFDPASQNWTPGPRMVSGRFGPSVKLLADGRVLVAGGLVGIDQVSASAEIYDPKQNTWTATAPMSTPRLGATALLLRTGVVLVAGGTSAVFNQDSSLDSAEVYNPGTASWSAIARMPSVHADAAGAVMPDGEAMIAGGLDFQGGFGVAVGETDFYNPLNQRWRVGPPLVLARGQAGSTQLSDGSVLMVGGISRQSSRSELTAETFSWAAGHWTILPLLPDRRIGPLVAPLKGGGALIVGGEQSLTALDYQAPPPDALSLGPPTLTNAVRANPLLSGATALLALAVGIQALIRRRRLQIPLRTP